MALVVEKFGGSSVADVKRIKAVAGHVTKRRREGDDIVLVVSAMGSETDHLLHIASQVAHQPPKREVDMLITGGERKACALVAMAISALGVPALSLTGSQAGFLTDITHSNAKILSITPERVKRALANGACACNRWLSGRLKRKKCHIFGQRRLRYHSGGFSTCHSSRFMRVVHRCFWSVY